jgi:hypothetical protein
VPASASPNVGNYIKTNVDDIVDYFMANTNGYRSIPNFQTVILNDAVLANLTSRDTKTILLETADDLIVGQDTGTRFWIQSLFTTEANTTVDYLADWYLSFDPALAPYFTASYDVMRNYLRTLTISIPGSEANANAMVNAMFSTAVAVVNNPSSYVEIFKSTVEAASHQFSYAGSGVNFNALPFGQKATGQASDPLTNLYTSNGGVVYATFNTEAGDTYLGTDLKIDFERSTIEGQAFSRGVQNITLPLIIGVGG